MKRISQDLRERIAGALESGSGQKAVAERFQVSKSFVEKLWRRVRETGSYAAKARGGGRQRSLKGYDEALRAQVSERADATLEELCEAMASSVGVRVSTPTMHRELKRLALPVKKKITTPASKTSRKSKPSERATKR